ncbi:3-hydroxybutyrate dehydrogenase [Planctomicrobium sp. SH661]|uniref:3-hydroxybutyrate dehydrogenase n=1 Tax=Planctomicrobium sp. SH661 TaxID=3448124 RepID=UPI003F5B10A4
MINTPRSILITGAGSGVGRGLSQYLAAQGHRIIATDLRSEAAEETVRLIQTAGGVANSFQLDVTSEDSVKNCLSQIGDLPVDVLINNAGLQHVSRIDEFATEKWDLLCDVMIKGAFLMSQAVLPKMQQGGYGRLIHIGSIHSLVASPFKSAYTASKHALLGLSKVLALETAASDITSNVICPAYVRTPLVEAQIADQARTRGMPVEEVIEKIMLAPMPKKSFITVEEVAGAVEYLMSPLARNVTGQTITIDGGWTAQ